MKVWIILFILINISLLSLVSSENQWYVAPNGTSSGVGSMNDPWNLQTALNHPITVKPGDTIWLKGGNYNGVFESYLEGNSTHPIYVRQYPNERAVLSWYSSSGDNSSNTLKVLSSYVWYMNFEVTSTNMKRSTNMNGSFPTDTSYGEGIFEKKGTNNKFINLLIHDNPVGVGIWSSSSKSETYGNLIYYNGWIAPDRAHGHGVYGQNNETGVKEISNNIIFSNADQGSQIYGTSIAYISNFNLKENIYFNNGDLFSSSTGGRNLLVGGLVIGQNETIKDNYFYRSQFSGGGGTSDLYVGYTSGLSNSNVEGNYIPTTSLFNLISNVIVNDNTFFGSVSGLNQALYPNNNYLTVRPTSNRIFVMPNKYENGRGNIVIYNWQNLTLVSVNLSKTGLNVGEDYQLHNVQNFFGDVIKGKYDGNNITISMTNRTVATPRGLTESPTSTFPDFGAFVIIRDASNYHPADKDHNLKINNTEIASYNFCWKTFGCTTYGEPISTSFISNANFIWKSRFDSLYHYVGGSCPACYVSGS